MLVIGNDSGPAHVAEAVWAPTVAVFGTAAPDRWGSLEPALHASVEAPGAGHPCRDEPCIARADLGRVVEAARRELAAGRICDGDGAGIVVGSTDGPSDEPLRVTS